jgi:hypothetical protein
LPVSLLLFHITNQVRTFEAMTGYPSAFGTTETAPLRIPARNAFSSKQRATCTSATLEQIDKLAKHLKDASTAADLRCIIVEGIQKWFLTDDTKESDEPDPTTQMGWFQVITYHISGASHKRFPSKLKNLTGERWTTQPITFFWTQSPYH